MHKPTKFKETMEEQRKNNKNTNFNNKNHKSSFVKLKTPKEERKMYFIPAFAIKASQEEIPKLIKEKFNGEYFRFLKKVKKNKNNEFLLLKGTANFPGSIQVEIPAFEPTTKTQFEEANSVWPCYFYSPFVEKIDQNLLNFQIDTFLGTINSKAWSYNYCSGFCLIFDQNKLLISNFDQEYICGHSIINSVSFVSSSKIGYLCTGYTAFLYREPCMSCAMALVHGRIGRVFVLNKTKEGSFSKYKLNYNSDLNHRYNVYFYSEQSLS